MQSNAACGHLLKCCVVSYSIEVAAGCNKTMPKETDELIGEMADLLMRWTNHLAEKKEEKLLGANPRKKVAKFRRTHQAGARHEQYQIIKALYVFIIEDSRFSIGAKDGKIKLPPGIRIKNARLIKKIVGEAFRVAYGDEARSKRQQAHVWGTVLSCAWRDKTSSSNFVSFLFDQGGIQEVYRMSKE